VPITPRWTTISSLQGEGRTRHDDVPRQTPTGFDVAAGTFANAPRASRHAAARAMIFARVLMGDFPLSIKRVILM
jgi:hypothetical protein